MMLRKISCSCNTLSSSKVLLYVFSRKTFIIVIGVNTRREAAKRVDEVISNTRAHENEAPPKDNQVPPLEQVPMDGQVSVVLPPMMDGEIREELSIMPKS